MKYGVYPKKPITTMPIEYKGMGYQVCTKSLPQKCYDMKGQGVITDTIKGIYKHFRNLFLAKDLSPKFIQVIKKYGAQEIKSIIVGRDPVMKVIQSIVNLLSGGKYESAKKLLNYDDVYHLYLVITLDNGVKLRLEKNQIPQIYTYNGTPKESIPVSLDKKISLAEFVGKARQLYGPYAFVNYDAVERNCQVFVDNLLNASNLNSPTIRKFVLQDIQKLLPDTVKSIGGVVTDIAGALSNLFGGKKRKLVGGSMKPPMHIERPAVMIGKGVCRFN
jgi:hypothetical protein